MIKLFIAQPMTGLTDDQINEQRKIIYKAYLDMEDLTEDKVYLIDQVNLPNPDITIDGTTYDDLHANRQRVALLGRSIMRLAYADVVIFAGDWQNSDGAKIEHRICEDRGIAIVESSDLIEWMMCHRYPGDNFEKVFPELLSMGDFMSARQVTIKGFSVTELGILENNTDFEEGEQVIAVKLPSYSASNICALTCRKINPADYGVEKYEPHDVFIDQTLADQLGYDFDDFDNILILRNKENN